MLRYPVARPLGGVSKAIFPPLTSEEAGVCRPLGGVRTAILFSLLRCRMLGSWGMWRYPVARPLGGVSQTTSTRWCEKGGRESAKEKSREREGLF
jgi:hypothetical protein